MKVLEYVSGLSGDTHYDYVNELRLHKPQFIRVDNAVFRYVYSTEGQTIYVARHKFKVLADHELYDNPSISHIGLSSKTEQQTLETLLFDWKDNNG